MNSDSPIQDIEDDYFNYGPYANTVAKELSNGSRGNFVAGIESPWGSGKTSFLNLVRKAIERHDASCVILEYCPWIYSNLDALLIGFCQQLSVQLNRPLPDGTELKKIGQALSVLSNVVSLAKIMPGVSPLVEAGAIALQAGADSLHSASEFVKRDIFTARKEVEDSIAKSEKRIFVIIDDIDRLSPDEIRLLFQFLKSVADFKSVTYLLAYDPTPVIQALSFNNSLNGEEYLKKFIQLPIRLPRLSKSQLTLYYLGVTKQAFNRRSVDGRRNLKALQENASQIIGHPVFKTPRDIIRVLNSFKLRLRDMQGEVEPLAIIQYVCLDLFCPQAIDVARQAPEHFFSLASRYHNEVGGSSIYSFLEDTSTDRRSKQKELLDTVPDSIRDKVVGLCNDLFAPHETSESSVQSAANPHALLKLLYGGTYPLSFSVKEAKDFLAGKKQRAILDRKLREGTLDDWLYFLIGNIGGAKLSSPVNTALLLEEYAEKPQGDSKRGIHSTTRIVADILPEVIKEVSDSARRIDFMKNFIKDSMNLYVSEILLVHLSVDVGIWKDGLSYPVETPLRDSRFSYGLSAESVKEAQAIWLQKVAKVAEERNILIDPHSISNLHRWGQFSGNDYTQVQRYVQERALQHEVGVMFKGFSLECGLDGLWKMLPSDLTAIRQSIQVEPLESSEKIKIGRILDCVEEHRRSSQEENLTNTECLSQ